VLRELDVLYAAGWRGSVFFVDDNFIANRREVLSLLPEVERWQEEHGWPFAFYTEASVDLATQPKLVEAMVAAGFTTVFLGIESPSAESLRETHKLQNLRMELNESVARITRAGLEVYAGFIVGFDSDGPGIFQVQRTFIDGLPIPAAMIGILTALPRTGLWRRLEKEGRLLRNATGDHFARPNFVTKLDEATLIAGYRNLLAGLYSADSYYARCAHMVDELGKPRRRSVGLRDLGMLLRITLYVGVLSPRRRHFWKLMARALRRPHSLTQALSMAVQGEHFIRYTREDVLPRLDAALADVARERAAPTPRTAPPPPPSVLEGGLPRLTQLRH
jgi:hypothetical protein